MVNRILILIIRFLFLVYRNHKELNPANDLNKPERGPELQIRTQPSQQVDFHLVRPKSEDPVMPGPDFQLTHWQLINKCCF